MPVNKVDINGETILDLTNDTVTANRMLSGTTAHDASGEEIIGSIQTISKDEVDEYKTIPLSGGKVEFYAIVPSVNTHQISSNIYLDAPLLIKGDSNLIQENIVKGKTIFGIEGTADTSGVDTSNDTVIASKLANGFTAHDSNGDQITGTLYYFSSDTSNLNGIQNDSGVNISGVGLSRNKKLYISFTMKEDEIIGKRTNHIVCTDAPDDLTSENILKGKNILGVNGSLSVNQFRTGASEPDNSLGLDGDWYLVTEG